MCDEILRYAEGIVQARGRVLIAVDGRCGAGKTTLSEKLRERAECNVIHLDAFFLRPEQRSAFRLAEPGGNVDYERFSAEVLEPLVRGEEFSYRPYICKNGGFGEKIAVAQRPITVVEGSYSCHPRFWESYDLHVFLDVSEKEQLRRITARNGAESAKKFRDVWIPLEERYFSEFGIKNRCELIFDTTPEKAEQA